MDNSLPPPLEKGSPPKSRSSSSKKRPSPPPVTPLSLTLVKNNKLKKLLDERPHSASTLQNLLSAHQYQLLDEFMKFFLISVIQDHTYHSYRFLLKNLNLITLPNLNKEEFIVSFSDFIINYYKLPHISPSLEAWLTTDQRVEQNYQIYRQIVAQIPHLSKSGLNSKMTLKEFFSIIQDHEWNENLILALFPQLLNSPTYKFKPLYELKAPLINPQQGIKILTDHDYQGLSAMIKTILIDALMSWKLIEPFLTKTEFHEALLTKIGYKFNLLSVPEEYRQFIQHDPYVKKAYKISSYIYNYLPEIHIRGSNPKLDLPEIAILIQEQPLDYALIKKLYPLKNVKWPEDQLKSTKNPEIKQKIRDFQSGLSLNEMIKKALIQKIENIIMNQSPKKSPTTAQQMTINQLNFKSNDAPSIEEFRYLVIQQILSVEQYPYLPNEYINVLISPRLIKLYRIYESIIKQIYQAPVLYSVLGINPLTTVKNILKIIQDHPFNYQLEEAIFNQPLKLVTENKISPSHKIPVWSSDQVIIRSNKDFDSLHADEIFNSFNFSLLNPATQESLKGLSVLQTRQKIKGIFKPIYRLTIEDIFRKSIIYYYSTFSHSNILAIKQYFQTVLNHPEFFEICDVNSPYLTPIDISVLELYIIYANHQQLGLDPFIPLFISIFPHHNQTTAVKIIYTNMILNAWLASARAFLESGSYLPIVIEIGIYTPQGNHAITSYLIPCQKNEGLQWYNLWFDSSDLIRGHEDDSEFRKSYEFIQECIHWAWVQYRTHLEPYFNRKESYTVTDCARNIQGPYNTCQLWSTAWTINILFNLKTYSQSFCNQSVVEKFCTVFSNIISIPQQRQENIKYIQGLSYLLKKLVFYAISIPILNSKNEHKQFKVLDFNLIFKTLKLNPLATETTSELKTESTATTTDQEKQTFLEHQNNILKSRQVLQEIKEALTNYNIFKGLQIENEEYLRGLHDQPLPANFNLLQQATARARITDLKPRRVGYVERSRKRIDRYQYQQNK